MTDNLVALAALLLAIMALSGCESLKGWEARQKYEQYGCKYQAKENGFCCRDVVPESDWWIMDCKYWRE